MGREVKRVELGFDWPIGELWRGYVNPHYRECPANCEGGYSPLYKALEPHVRQILKLGEKSRWSTPVEGARAFCETLSEKEPTDPFGFDCIAAWTATKKIMAAGGLDPETATTCPVCGGDGVDPEVKAAYEAWEREDPPAGDGWQLWSTTTEGHPMTPVFATADELARYCADEKVSSFGGMTQTYLEWLEFFEGPGWAPSAVTVNGVFMSGVEAV